MLHQLVDAPEVQRLRWISQAGLTSFVFPGAEHSRFQHSIGVMQTARRMYHSTCRNSGIAPNPDQELALCAAALLHDVGHGPFSHLFEEWYLEPSVSYRHEKVSSRVLLEDTEVNRILRSVDGSFPGVVAAYVDVEMQGAADWTYRILDGQLDADRIDYTHRDALFAGLRGHGYDLERLLDFLVVDPRWPRLMVHRKGIEAVEAYLVMLNHLYRAVYYHHTARAAAVLLGSWFRTVAALVHEHGAAFLGLTASHPLPRVLSSGDQADIGALTRLADYHVWAAAEVWASDTPPKDPVLADLSRRLLHRDLLKTLELPDALLHNPDQLYALVEQVRVKTGDALSLPNVESAKLYCTLDGPDRVAYQRYAWDESRHDRSIWIVRDDGEPVPIEDLDYGRVLEAMRERRYFHRITYPREVEGFAQQTFTP